MSVATLLAKRIANIPNTKFPTIYKSAGTMRPLSSNTKLSNSKVEKVVSAPRNPVAMPSRNAGESCSSFKKNSKAKQNEPTTLTKSVASGKPLS